MGVDIPGYEEQKEDGAGKDDKREGAKLEWPHEC